MITFRHQGVPVTTESKAPSTAMGRKIEAPAPTLCNPYCPAEAGGVVDW